MKWILLLTLLGLIGWTAAQNMVSVAGGSSNSQLICPLNPYWTTATPTCSTNFLVLITSPLNGSNLYSPQVTKNTTVSVLSPVSITGCYYRAGGAWTPFLNCGVGVNGTYDLITYTEGYPLEVDINITTSCGSVVNQTFINVIYWSGGPSLDLTYYVLALAGLLLLVWFWWVEDDN